MSRNRPRVPPKLKDDRAARAPKATWIAALVLEQVEPIWNPHWVTSSRISREIREIAQAEAER